MNGNLLALHTDKYQINMMYAHWKFGTHQRKAAFELFFRKHPFKHGFAVFAGLQRLIEYINDLHFSEDMIHYLRQQDEHYDEAFLEELSQLKFTGSLYAVKEGAIVFANEPLIRVEARIMEAQLIETALLNFVNFQTLIATKAARIRQSAGDGMLLEFGTRRAQEADAALWGTRASYIAGFDATSNMLAGMQFGIPTQGTHAHAWIQMHQTEIEAFTRYAEALPDQVTLLVDTYDTLGSGVPNAIEVGKQLQRVGKRLNAIRLDSGDLAYLSQQARVMLDKAGFNEVKIIASNDLDEHTIHHLRSQGAAIDIWGVGTKLITAADDPALGGVYKLTAKEDHNGAWEPTIKISGNPEKVTTPGIKRCYRLLDSKTGMAVGDYLTLQDESIDLSQSIQLFHPDFPYLNKTITDYKAIPLLHEVFVNGTQVMALPTLDETRQYHDEQLRMFWPEYRRIVNPERYPVGLSDQLWHLKKDLINKHSK